MDVTPSFPRVRWGETRRGIGPGTPYFEDASDKFRAALREFDFRETERETNEARSLRLCWRTLVNMMRDALASVESREPCGSRARV